MTTERAVLIIQDYMLDMTLPVRDLDSKRYRPQKIPWKRCNFDQKSYSRWAVKEVLRYVQEHPDKSPVSVIEEFVNLMDRYACASRKNSYIFSVAYDIAVDILDVFLAMM